MGHGSNMTAGLRGRWLWQLIFGAGLIFCLIWLIMAHYNSQVQLQKGLLKAYQQEVDLQAFATENFFQERRDDVLDLSRSQIIASFFANRALGMSMQYGLKASLVRIREHFRQIVSDKTFNGKAIYHCIVMLDKNDKTLASTHADPKGSSSIKQIYDSAGATPAGQPAVVTGIWHNQKSVVLIMPIWFKGDLAGFVVAQVNHNLLLDENFYPVKNKLRQGLLLLIKQGNQLVPICSKAKLSSGTRKLISELPVAGVMEKPLLTEYPANRIVRTYPIKNTPLLLFASADKALIEGSPDAEHILYFLAVMISVLLAGLAILIRTEIRSSDLRLRLVKNEAEKVAELERVNSQLDGQITERIRAENDATQKNILLSGLNLILLDAMQKTTVEDVADKCLGVISGLTGCRDGVIGVFAEDGRLKPLGFLYAGKTGDDLESRHIRHGGMPIAMGELFEDVKKTGELLILNGPEVIRQRADLPDKHIRLNSLLAAPLLKEGRAIGIIAIANKKGRFDAGDADYLRELSASFITVLVQKQTDEALRMSEERNRTLVESITEGLLIVDEKANITYVNDNMLDMVGLKEREVLGRTVYDFLDDANKKIVAKNFEMRKKGSLEPYELAWNTPNGAKMHTMVYPKPFFGDNGRFRGALALVTDLSAAKARESQILQAQKLEAIGQLAAGIAHEINTPTNFVANNAMFLKDGFAGLAKALNAYAELQNAVAEHRPTRQALDSIAKIREETSLDYVLQEIPPAIDETLEGLEHIANIVRSMKKFAHPGIDTKSFVDLNETIRNTITVAKNEWKYVAEMELDLDPDLPPVLCVPSQINQVILNLIVNAAQAMEPNGDGEREAKGIITITTRELDDLVEVRIADNGPGIPEDIQQRIFEPFFTTKEPGKGTGQGLAISHAVIVEKHGGSLTVESDGKTGSTFVIDLPVNSDEDQS